MSKLDFLPASIQHLSVLFCVPFVFCEFLPLLALEKTQLLQCHLHFSVPLIILWNESMFEMILLTFLHESLSLFTLESLFARSCGSTHCLSASLPVLIFPPLLLWSENKSDLSLILSGDNHSRSLFTESRVQTAFSLFLTLGIAPLDLCLSFLVPGLFECYDPPN